MALSRKIAELCGGWRGSYQQKVYEEELQKKRAEQSQLKATRGDE